ncbi:MAG: tetratricopeptide repeat protein [Rubripirellula sp.]
MADQFKVAFQVLPGILAMLIFFGGCEPRTAHDFNRRGVAWHAEGEYERAVADFAAALRLEPTDSIMAANLHLNRGLILDETQAYRKAVDEYTKSLEFDVSSAYVYGLRGDAWFHLKEHQKAVDDFTVSIRLDPFDTTYFVNRANNYQTLGEFDKAIADYTRVIRLAPDLSEGYVLRGESKFAKRDYAGAIFDFNQAIHRDDECVEAYRKRGLSFQKIGAAEQANRDIERAEWLDSTLEATE